MLISVCIPTYNRSALLREALHSVLDQPLNDVEIIISDNASTDGTPEVVASFNEPGLKYYRSAVNMGAGLNHRTCVAYSTSPWILFLHDDDLLLPEV